MNKEIEEFNKKIQKHNEEVIKSSNGNVTSLREIIKKERIAVLGVSKYRNLDFCNSKKDNEV